MIKNNFFNIVTKINYLKTKKEIKIKKINKTFEIEDLTTNRKKNKIINIYV